MWSKAKLFESVKEISDKKFAKSKILEGRFLNEMLNKNI